MSNGTLRGIPQQTAIKAELIIRWINGRIHVEYPQNKQLCRMMLNQARDVIEDAKPPEAIGIEKATPEITKALLG